MSLLHSTSLLTRASSSGVEAFRQVLKLPAVGMATPALSRRLSSPASSVWDGSMSQEEFMERDMCVLVDERDRVVGSASKYDAHRVSSSQPCGRLHRAFSVFLFDAQNRLLLQQRAAGKKTFANVWTNTCCSHPLHGMEPPEVDGPEDTASGSVPGTKRAIARKLEHELGMSRSLVPPARLHYLARLHYGAPDKGAVWGEHEMDYILVGKLPELSIGSLRPNAEEVSAVRFVTQAELREMMSPASGLLWSPWFQIIAQRLLPRWWDNLDAVVAGEERWKDLDTIHRLG